MLRLCLALAFFAGCRSTPVAMPTSTQSGFYRTHVGAIDVTVISDGTLKLDVTKGLAINAKDGEVERLLAKQFQTSPIDASFNEFVISSNGHIALIDTGSDVNMGPTAGKLGQSLRNAGVRPEDVTDIFLTHIHPDHSGGLVHAGQRVFPNATIHVEARELAYWMDAQRAAAAKDMSAFFFSTAKAALAPYEGRVKTFDGETEFFTGFRALPAVGHTPGHVTYELSSNGESLVFLGDMIHIGAVQFEDPNVAVGFDVDPSAAVSTRQQWLGQLAKSGAMVAQNHLPFPGLGHVRRDGENFAWVPAPYVNDR